MLTKIMSIYVIMYLTIIGVALLVAPIRGETLPETITIRHPCGVTTYCRESLDALRKADTASYNLVMRLYHKQLAEHQELKRVKQPRTDARRYRLGVVVNTEILSDDYGNDAIIHHYADGRIVMIGDIIYGGKSYRSMHNIR